MERGRPWLRAKISRADKNFRAMRKRTTGGPMTNPTTSQEKVTIVELSDAGQRQTVEAPKVVKSEDEWRTQLPPQAFEVTRHDGTEPAFTGKYWDLHEDVINRCY